MRVCIVIPVYNEEGMIERNLKTIIASARQLPDPTTVIAVNDGSRDRTEAILFALSKGYTDDVFHVVSYTPNRGYGGAIKAGIACALDRGFDYALFMDSDLTNHPKYLAEFYERMRAGCEYIKATRYAKGGGMEGVPWKRRLFSHVGNLIGGTLFRLPLTDVTNGFRAVKVNILRGLHLKENGFPIIMEELCQAKKLVRSFGEVPYILTDRKAGQGDTHFPYTMRTMAIYLRYALIAFFYARPI